MISIAIDGPSGAGKSTIAKILAKELGYIYIDTGALYRAVGLFALRQGVEPDDREDVTGLLGGVDVALRFVNGEQRVVLNGGDVSREIRRPEVSMAASAVSAIPAVREFLFVLQRSIAKSGDCLMDGRDIGTVVLPDASVKIFLTASPEERAGRRYKELREKGLDVEYETVLAELKQRDHNDSTRAAAPLKQAADAVLVDTTGIELPQAVELIKNIILDKINSQEEKP